jgi:hypothetical protein
VTCYGVDVRHRDDAKSRSYLATVMHSSSRDDIQDDLDTKFKYKQSGIANEIMATICDCQKISEDSQRLK